MNGANRRGHGDQKSQGLKGTGRTALLPRFGPPPFPDCGTLAKGGDAARHPLSPTTPGTASGTGSCRSSSHWARGKTARIQRLPTPG